MSDLTLQFGSYIFPGEFNVTSIEGNNRIAAIEAPRRDGVIISDPTKEAKRIQIEGRLRAGVADIRTQLDTMKAALYGTRAALYTHTDRYIMATLNSFTDDYDPGLMESFCNVGLDFLCDSPFWEAATASSDTWTTPVSASTHDIVVAGNAYVLPTFTITTATTGTLDIRLAFGSIYFDLDGAVTDGDVIVVNCSDETVTIAAVDKITYFDGQFFQFLPGTNTITYTKNSGAPTVASIVTSWRHRWH